MVVRMLSAVLRLLATLKTSVQAETPDKDALTVMVMDSLCHQLYAGKS